MTRGDCDMERPKIVINGKEHTPPSPKMKVWRHVIEGDGKPTDGGDISALMAWYVDGIAEIYGVPPEAVENDIDAADVITTYRKAANWVAVQIYEGLKDVPKADAAGA